MGTCPAPQMQKALASTRASEDFVRAQQEQERKDLEQRVDEVHAEALGVEANFQDMRGRLEKLKAGERPAQLFPLGGCDEPPQRAQPAASLGGGVPQRLCVLACLSIPDPSCRPSCRPSRVRLPWVCSQLHHLGSLCVVSTAEPPWQ